MTGLAWKPDHQLWLNVQGARLEARCWGPPPSLLPTLVLLHEGLGCVALWRDFPERLAEATGLGVFAFSRRGYGASDPCTLPRPIDYMEREAADVLGPVLDAAGIRDAILIGHSDGGSIAALYAGGPRDERVKGLVLMAPHFFVEDISVQAIAAAGRTYETGDLRGRLARYHADVEAAFQGWHGAWLDPAFRTWDITAALRQIEMPVLALQGEDDPYGTAAQVEVIAEVLSTRAEVHLIAECQHAPHLEQPGRTLDLIGDFVRHLTAANRIL